MGVFNKHVMLLGLIIALWEALVVSARTQGHSGEDIVIAFEPITVRVCNVLGEGLNLNVHCKSKDDDLGRHETLYQRCYEWKFRVNFWGTTLFFCNVKWRDGEGTWDLFVAKRDMDRCYNQCVWEATSDGLYGYDDTGATDLFFKWSKPPN